MRPAAASPIAMRTTRPTRMATNTATSGGADRKIMDDASRRSFIRPRRVQTRAKAAMIRSACGRSASAFWNGPPGRPDSHARPARQHMEVQMEDLLAAGLLVELLEGEPFRLHAGLDRVRDLLHRRHEAGEILGARYRRCCGREPSGSPAYGRRRAASRRGRRATRRPRRPCTRAPRRAESWRRCCSGS